MNASLRLRGKNNKIIRNHAYPCMVTGKMILWKQNDVGRWEYLTETFFIQDIEKIYIHRYTYEDWCRVTTADGIVLYVGGKVGLIRWINSKRMMITSI